MKFPNKREFHSSGYSSDIDSKNFLKLYKDITKKPCSFSVNGKTLSSDNPLRFRTTYYRKEY